MLCSMDWWLKPGVKKANIGIKNDNNLFWSRFDWLGLLYMVIHVCVLLKLQKMKPFNETFPPLLTLNQYYGRPPPRRSTTIKSPYKLALRVCVGARAHSFRCRKLSAVFLFFCFVFSFFSKCFMIPFEDFSVIDWWYPQDAAKKVIKNIVLNRHFFLCIFLIPFWNKELHEYGILNYELVENGDSFYEVYVFPN